MGMRAVTQPGRLVPCIASRFLPRVQLGFLEPGCSSPPALLGMWGTAQPCLCRGATPLMALLPAQPDVLLLALLQMAMCPGL